MSSIDPEEALAKMIAGAKHSLKRRNLSAVAEYCRDHASKGLTRIRVRDLGKHLEARGIMSRATLYNKQSSDYKYLIECWNQRIGARQCSVPTQILELEEASKIARLEAKTEYLKQENAVLKANIAPIVDLRSSHGTTPRIALSRGEILALQHAVSAQFLADQSWSTGEAGEIRNHAGRMIFRPGFCNAIAKILSHQAPGDET